MLIDDSVISGRRERDFREESAASAIIDYAVATGRPNLALIPYMYFNQLHNHRHRRKAAPD